MTSMEDLKKATPAELLQVLDPTQAWDYSTTVAIYEVLKQKADVWTPARLARLAEMMEDHGLGTLAKEAGSPNLCMAVVDLFIQKVREEGQHTNVAVSKVARHQMLTFLREVCYEWPYMLDSVCTRVTQIIRESPDPAHLREMFLSSGILSTGGMEGYHSRLVLAAFKGGGTNWPGLFWGMARTTLMGDQIRFLFGTMQQEEEFNSMFFSWLETHHPATVDLPMDMIVLAMTKCYPPSLDRPV